MIRRVVNLVVRSNSTGVHSVRRFDPYKPLFYESADDAAAAKANKGVDSNRGMQMLTLPDPVVSFAPSPTSLPLPHEGSLDFFALLGSRGSEGKIVSANMAGETVLYDADERLFLNLPWLSEPKGWNPVCLSVAVPGVAENSLYVIDRRPGAAAHRFHNIREEYVTSCFEVLEYGIKGFPNERTGWRWRVLPPPPFALRPGYEPGDITAYTTMLNADDDGCSTICISGDHHIGGTYCFDTSRRSEKWRQVGEWTLPIQGKAHYVPEFNLWFGFSLETLNLCALDLSVLEQQQTPTVRHLFEDLNPPVEEDWVPMFSDLVYLGAGKFCVAKSFDADDTIGQQFAVLTGIEIVRGADDQGLHMVKHKSKCCGFNKGKIYWVL